MQPNKDKIEWPELTKETKDFFSIFIDQQIYDKVPCSLCGEQLNIITLITRANYNFHDKCFKKILSDYWDVIPEVVGDRDCLCCDHDCEELDCTCMQN